MAWPTPLTDAHAPTARARRCPANIQLIRAITTGASGAIARPPTERHAINNGNVGAVAAPTAHTAVLTSARQYVRLRPNRSPIHPASGNVAENVNRNPTTTNTPLLSGASKSSRMTARGTLRTLLEMV